MNAIITISIIATLILIAVPVCSFLYDAIPALIESFKGWLNWITYEEE